MVLLQLDNGKIEKLDPQVELDLRRLDTPKYQRQVRRVSMLNGKGGRVDLPVNKQGCYLMWMELVEKKGYIRGERFCMRTKSLLIRATLYYSDGRVVFDVDPCGGFVHV